MRLFFFGLFFLLVANNLNIPNILRGHSDAPTVFRSLFDPEAQTARTKDSRRKGRNCVPIIVNTFLVGAAWRFL